jgi:hypothetical protein
LVQGLLGCVLRLLLNLSFDSALRDEMVSRSARIVPQLGKDELKPLSLVLSSSTLQTELNTKHEQDKGFFTQTGTRVLAFSSSTTFQRLAAIAAIVASQCILNLR